MREILYIALSLSFSLSLSPIVTPCYDRPFFLFLKPSLKPTPPILFKISTYIFTYHKE